MERLSRNFLAFLKLYKFLGNICSFEQFFFKKRRWVPLRSVQVEEKCYPPKHSVDSADNSFLGLHINFSDQIMPLKPNPCDNCLILSRDTKKSALADSGPGVTVKGIPAFWACPFPFHLPTPRASSRDREM